MTNINRRRFPILLASALAVLAILGALFLPDRAQAQAQTIVLVSNIEQTSSSFLDLNPVGIDNALQFTTGGNTGGYNLDSVELKVKNYENVVLTVSLYSDSSGVPGSSIFTFDNPDPITANANNTFTAPANTTLMASTPYHIVVSGTNDPDESSNIVRLAISSSNVEDEGGATDSEGTPDWAIADDGYFYSQGAWHDSSSSIQIRVNGSAAGGDPPPLSTDATLSGLSLGTGVTLSPAFASGTDTYTASVANSVDEVTVTTTTNHTSATVEILDTDDTELDDADDVEDDFQVTLSVGDTVIKVKVTAEDGTSTQTYTVTVTRAAEMTPATCTLYTGEFWCGVMTVGTFMVGTTSHLGYWGGTGGGGMLSDTEFEFTNNLMDSASHTITAVTFASGTLSLVFEDSQDIDETPVLDTWVLQVGTDTFALDDDDVAVLPSGGYQWSGTGLSWSVGDTVTLRLRGASAPQPVASVAVTSMPLLTSSGGSEQDTYGAGDEIEFTVTFSQAVTVTGDPQFGFSLGGSLQADYDSDSGSTALKFVYTVQSSDSDDDGIWIGNHNSTNKSLQLDTNDEITSAGGIDANLEHDELGVQAGHKVDGSRSSKPTLSIADAAATEGSNVSFTVTLSEVAAAVVTATWTATIGSGDTAVAADLGATKTGMVTVAIGDTDATITVATATDTTVEVNETFTVTLSGVSSNAQLSSTAATAQGTINNDDLATVSFADAEGDEDEGVEFTLTLSAAAPEDVTVDWTASIESGNSASTADLATTKTGTVTITKGVTTKKFTVPVNDDTTDEPDQTFTVTLSNPTPTSLAQLAADPTATGTIDDDDDPPTLTVADARHVEDNSDSRARVTASLSEVSEKRVRFKLRPVDRTGDTASDADWNELYSSPPFNTISAGTMSTERFGGVVIQKDTLDEDDETLTVEAYSLENAQGSSSDREATITIEDDDPTPTVTVADAAATEGDKVEFVVTLSAVSGRDVDVDYATSVATGDGAVSGTDFTAASGTLTIAAADSTATGTIEVQTTEDDASESAETFTLTISSPDNATLTTDTTATGTINNRATTAAEPTTFAAAVGNAQVVLSWDAPDSASGVTRHEYQYKEGTGAYGGWEQIANSGVGGANEVGFTVTGLTNEVLHTFQLRAVNAQGESTAAEADAVTPTPGICDRTQKMHEIIVDYLSDRDNCAEVNVADLESFTLSLEMAGENIASLKSGDFAGLSNLLTLELSRNTFTTLPANVFSGLTSLKALKLDAGELSSLDAQAFSGLTALEQLHLSDHDLMSLPGTVFSGLTALITLKLDNNDLSSLPVGLFSGLTALEQLHLNDNDLTSLDAGLFSGLAALEELELQDNDLGSLPGTVFSGLTALESLSLNDNDLNSLDAGVFSGLSNLQTLGLRNNKLSSLPDGLFSGLRGLTALRLNGNTVDPLPLTVTVEKFGTDRARAKVLAGAPAPLSFNVTVVNGSLPTGVTKLAVAAGSVDGTAERVTRTSGTMAAVTVDIDLSTQPTLPTDHSGYEFVKATSGLPATILPDTRGPQNFTAKPGDGQAVLSWTAPASGSGVTKHQYRQKEGTGSYGNWFDIPNSVEGEANEDGYTVTGLTNETVYTFELKRFVGTTESATAESNAVTPTPGICDRTQEVQDGILAAVSGVTECEAVTVANLAGIDHLGLTNKGITSLKAGDFAGLTALEDLLLARNSLDELPPRVFDGLTQLRVLRLNGNDLTTLPAGVFSGLSKLESLALQENELQSLRADAFSGLAGLSQLELDGNPDDGDTLPLTVTLEKVGSDRVRAKVLAGAPFSVAIPVTPANGTLAGDITALTVAAGSTESAAVTVTRTEGTTAAVTVDVDLSTQPVLPSDHEGYEFARAPSGLPAEILPEEASLEPPTGLSATPGDRQAVLTWTPPASDSGFTRHQYRYGTDGDFVDWTDIPDSGPGEANATRYTVTGLDNAVEYSFELRARDAGAGKSDAATVRVTPTGPPRILSVEVTSGPGLDGDTYGAGEEVDISVTFDQPVEVSGAPQLALNVGGSRLAEYHEGNGSKTLVFVYVVTESDRDTDGVSVGEDALRLNGGRIGNGAGDDAELDHEGLGQQSGHMVDGGRRAGVHDHGEFTHSHSHSRQQYPEHTHEGHEHPDEANGHKRRPGTHVHHAQEDLNAEISGGPEVRTHDGVEHIHRCFDLKPSCNQGDLYSERGDELGLPIEVTHSHVHSEPGHGYDWRAFFEEGGSGAMVSVADAVAVRGEGRTLDFEVSLEPAVAFAVRVNYATADGTATAGEDYLGTSGVLEIPPGQTRGTVSVRMPADGPGDGPELFKLTLGSATAATVADGAATGTILMPGPSTPPVIERIAVVSTPRLS